MARGFSGEMRTYSDYQMRRADWLALAAALLLGVAALAAQRVVP